MTTTPTRWPRTAIEETEAEPTRRRFIVNDPTVEKLGVILNENPNGVTLEYVTNSRASAALDKPGREDARAFYLECWAGDGRFTVDRSGAARWTFRLVACRIIGTVQPGPLQTYLFQLAAGGAG